MASRVRPNVRPVTAVVPADVDSAIIRQGGPGGSARRGTRPGADPRDHESVADPGLGETRIHLADNVVRFVRIKGVREGILQGSARVQYRRRRRIASVTRDRGQIGIARDLGIGPGVQAQLVKPRDLFVTVFGQGSQGRILLKNYLALEPKDQIGELVLTHRVERLLKRLGCHRRCNARVPRRKGARRRWPDGSGGDGWRCGAGDRLARLVQAAAPHETDSEQSDESNAHGAGSEWHQESRPVQGTPDIISEPQGARRN